MVKAVRKINAEIAADAPEKAKQAAANVRQNPTASPMDKAIAHAVSLQQQDRRAEAVEKWRAVAHVAEESDNDLAARAWFSVGYLVQNENPKAGMSAYDRAIRLKPDYAEAYNNRGSAKQALGQHDAALADCDEALRLKPDYAEAYYNRGNAKYALRRYEAAITDYDEAIRLKPDYAVAYNNRGNAKYALRRYDAALIDYDEALRLKSDYAVAYNNRGAAKAALGLKDDARKDFERALALATEAGNEELAAKAKRLLGNLDKGERS